MTTSTLTLPVSGEQDFGQLGRGRVRLQLPGLDASRTPVAALSRENVGTNHNDAAIIEACVGPRDSLMFHSMYSRVGPYRADIGFSGHRAEPRVPERDGSLRGDEPRGTRRRQRSCRPTRRRRAWARVGRRRGGHRRRELADAQGVDCGRFRRRETGAWKNAW